MQRENAEDETNKIHNNCGVRGTVVRFEGLMSKMGHFENEKLGAVADFHVNVRRKEVDKSVVCTAPSMKWCSSVV